MKKDTLIFAKAMLIRAAKTAAQVALGMFTVGQMFSEINWVQILSVAGVSAVYSILTSIVGGIPEAKTNGILYLKSGDTLGDQVRMRFDTPVEKITPGDTYTLKVVDYGEYIESEDDDNE
jgi:hypothetical protein